MGEQGDAERLFFEGNAHLSRHDLVAAEGCYRQALARSPEFAEAHANLGWVLETMGRRGEAENAYRAALRLNPSSVSVSLNLGSLLVTQKRFSEALVIYRDALAAHPAAAALWSNLGVLKACLEQDRDAETCYRTALEIDPSYAKARFNLSYLQLRHGNFDEGWASLEARDWYRPLEAQVPFPRWAGEDVVGKSILLAPEAGHGDMIQFCRYAGPLKEKGAARVGIVCYPGLTRLFETLDGIDVVMSLDRVLPDGNWDFWTPLLSVPFYLQTRLDTIPADLPYLHPLQALVDAWQVRLPSGRMKVGLAWQGSTRFENDADRSLAGLSALRPLWDIDGITLVSLQKGEGAAEASRPDRAMELFDASPWLEDFADTAAAMSCLDLVISVDTAVAHLAGAIGKTCWVLLPAYKTDWRWMKDRNDSPWYPGVMRLFRQPRPGDWTSVIGDVARQLAALRDPA